MTWMPNTALPTAKKTRTNVPTASAANFLATMRSLPCRTHESFREYLFRSATPAAQRDGGHGMGATLLGIAWCRTVWLSVNDADGYRSPGRHRARVRGHDTIRTGIGSRGRTGR